MNNIWFTSDTHFGHKNIVKGISKWENKEACRNFSSLEEHNETLVNNINNVVKWDDILYHTGDWSMGGVQNVKKFWDRLNCKTIHIILGNHDIHIAKKATNEHALFTTVNDLLFKKINGQYIYLCHCAARTWYKLNKGSWMLYGHSHGTLPDLKLKTMDIGIDTHNDFRPYHFDEIQSIMKHKIIEDAR